MALLAAIAVFTSAEFETVSGPLFVQCVTKKNEHRKIADRKGWYCFMKSLFGIESIKQKGETIAFIDGADGFCSFFIGIRIYEGAHTDPLYTQPP